MAHTDTDRTTATGERSTAVNGLVGALVTIILISVVPFAPLLGGVVAGYLEGRDVGDGVVAGLVSGVAAGAVATVFFAAFGSFFFGFVMMGGGPPGFGAFFVFALAAGFVAVVLFAAVGGAIGAYCNAEFGDDLGRL